MNLRRCDGNQGLFAVVGGNDDGRVEQNIPSSKGGSSANVLQSRTRDPEVSAEEYLHGLALTPLEWRSIER